MYFMFRSQYFVSSVSQDCLSTQCCLNGTASSHYHVNLNPAGRRRGPTAEWAETCKCSCMHPVVRALSVRVMPNTLENLIVFCLMWICGTSVGRVRGAAATRYLPFESKIHEFLHKKK